MTFTSMSPRLDASKSPDSSVQPVSVATEQLKAGTQ